MPPKLRFDKETLVQAGLELVRKNGFDSLTARCLGGALGCSPQPIFSCFENMEELKQEILERAYSIYLSYLQESMAGGLYPAYKASGMGYIRFAKEEPELFRMLFMRSRSREDHTTRNEDWDSVVELIMSANGFTRETAERLHLEMWVCVHGIASMMVTSFYPMDMELVSTILSDVYLGIRDRMLQLEDHA